ncbi:MAG: UDP-N-acetylmuramoyl-tripeptide--D-alanyl-D-alanine ligase, partial [Candidatus Sericytochromatia bacterium]|nr:UDP-N-acetylmuramoyl-tripeptide--D-alanyl-D-alanine ligase [Candidatus Tanganyikabacteria bacterium]
MLTIREILAATCGTLLRGSEDLAVFSVSTDTRNLEPGALYVSLVGERFDGHGFAADAVARGAVAVLVSRDAQVPENAAVVRVADTLQAFGHLARHWRRKLGIKIVAVTGSSGKTSTKEAIADLLGRFVPTAKSFANYNNEIGVPLTLLSLREGPEAAVLELAMRGSGEIRYLAEVAEPDIGVITNIGMAHIGRLGSREAIAAAKGELVAQMEDGIAILNGDDPYCRELGARHRHAIYFSTQGPENAHVWAASDLAQVDGAWQFRANWRIPGPESASASASVPASASETCLGPASGRDDRWGSPAGSAPAGSAPAASGTATVTLSIPGTHHVANALAAIAVAASLGYSLPAEFTLSPQPVGGRSRLIAVGDVEVLDESYNANPESVRATLDSFCKLPCPGRRVAVLGDMAELGDFSADEHRAIGRDLDALPIDVVVTVGEFADLIAEATTRETIRCRSNGEAVSELGRLLRPGDRLLVKGSRAGRLEEI